jgi:hypothetical protein
MDFWLSVAGHADLLVFYGFSRSAGQTIQRSLLIFFFVLDKQINLVTAN